MGFLSDLTWNTNCILHNIGIGGLYDAAAVKVSEFAEKCSTAKLNKLVNKSAEDYPERIFEKDSYGLLIDSETGTSPANPNFEEECALAYYGINVLKESPELVRDTINLMNITYARFETHSSETIAFAAAEAGYSSESLPLMISLAKKLAEYSKTLEEVESFTEKDIEPEKADMTTEQAKKPSQKQKSSRTKTQPVQDAQDDQ